MPSISIRVAATMGCDELHKPSIMTDEAQEHLDCPNDDVFARAHAIGNK